MNPNDVILAWLDEGFERALFESALATLQQCQNSLRLNNFANAIRELTRNVLLRLAPDEEVRACSWYKNETNLVDGVTRKQRMIYAVQGGLKDHYLIDELSIDADDVHKRLVHVLDRLSKFVHISLGTFDLPTEEVNQHACEALDALASLFKTIDSCRRELIVALENDLEEAVIDAVISDTVQEIDLLSTHYFVEMVRTDTVNVSTIGPHIVSFVVSGYVCCELQWGSNSDCDRGDGATMAESFPFTCILQSDVNCPDDVFIKSGDGLEIDTSSWWED